MLGLDVHVPFWVRETPLHESVVNMPLIDIRPRESPTALDP